MELSNYELWIVKNDESQKTEGITRKEEEEEGQSNERTKKKKIINFMRDSQILRIGQKKVTEL